MAAETLKENASQIIQGGSRLLEMMGDASL